MMLRRAMRAAYAEGELDARTGSPPNPLYEPTAPYVHWAYIAGYQQARRDTPTTPTAQPHGTTP